MSLSDLPTLMAAQGFTEREEPISLFEEWLKDAGKTEPNDANAMALATVDVALTALIFYVLLPDTPGLTFLVFLAVYVTAYTAAMASHVPGGLGVFDGTILVGLTDLVPAATDLLSGSWLVLRRGKRTFAGVEVR